MIQEANEQELYSSWVVIIQSYIFFGRDWDSFLLSMEWILVDKLNNTHIAFWQLKLDVSILGNKKIVELKNLVREIGRYVDFSREQEKRRRSWRHANYR